MGDNFTILDLVQGYGDDNVNKRLIPILTQRNAIFKDIVWKPSTHMDKNVVTVEAGKPTTTVGQINKGIPASRGATKQVTDTFAFLRSRFTIDKELETLGKSAYEQAMMTQGKMHANKMFEDMASYIFYGSEKPANGTQGFINGFANRMNSLSGEIGDQVVSGGGSGGDNTSIYGITWSDDDCYMFYPQGGQSGLQVENYKNQKEYDDVNNPFRVDEVVYKMYAGLAMPNYKNSFRIANIDVSDLAGGSAADLVKLIMAGVRSMQDTPPNWLPEDPRGGKEDITRAKGAKTVLYMNRTVYGFLEDQANEKTINGLVKGEAFGGRYFTIEGIPIRTCEAILNNETAVA